MSRNTGRMRVPEGFLFSAVEAAIKKPGRKDLALIFSEREAVMAGMFTTNRIQAAPVRMDRERLNSRRGRAVIVNSGNANACTGRQGMKDASEMAELVASPLGCKPADVYACSTGVIGVPLPMERIRRTVPELLGQVGRSSLQDVASAIMTTDTFPKLASRTIKIGGETVVLTGVCKGAGMIAPHMATMLCFLLTDARIGFRALNRALKNAVERSFNRITVDGDMSTNDTVLMMANGLAGNSAIRENSGDFRIFSAALSEVTGELCRMIVVDGEGATKLVTVEVRNAKSRSDADRAAFMVAGSLLVKTALYGNDANWGRIMAALGHSGAAVDEGKTDIFIGTVKVVSGGIATGKEAEASAAVRERELRITVDLHLGRASAEVITCDLTEEYVKVNAEYRT